MRLYNNECRCCLKPFTLAATTTTHLKKEKYYIDALIISGVCAFIIATVLFLKSRDITTEVLEFFIFFLIPWVLTLSVYSIMIASVHSEKLKQLILKRLFAAKVVSICFSIALGLYQLFFVSGWIMNFTNRHTPLDMKFLGYFMLVGFACNVWLLYQITEPGKRINTVA